MVKLMINAPQKNNAHFNCFDIKQSIAQTIKNQTSLDSPTHKEYKNLCLVSMGKGDKVTSAYLWCGKDEVIHRDFFVETDFVSGYADKYWEKYYLVDLAGNGECNERYHIFIVYFSSKIHLIV